MSPRPPHRETHRTERVGWLRAAVLGANDGLISTASLIVGRLTWKRRASSCSLSSCDPCGKAPPTMADSRLCAIW